MTGIDLSQVHYIHRLTLIHQTDVNAANSIIKQQKMLPGSPEGDFGAGIYFANTINTASLKANHVGTFLCADVYLGKYYPCPTGQNQILKDNMQIIKKKCYKGVIGYQMKDGREIVAFESSQVKNIKFCYG